MTEKPRIVEILRKDVWYNSNFKDIKRGDLFRMFDPPDNTPVIGTDGSCIFKATSGVCKHSTSDVLTINTIGVYNTENGLIN